MSLHRWLKPTGDEANSCASKEVLKELDKSERMLKIMVTKMPERTKMQNILAANISGFKVAAKSPMKMDA